MDTAEEIQRGIIACADSRQDEVLAGVIRFATLEHGVDFRCECNYCTTLQSLREYKEYVDSHKNQYKEWLDKWQAEYDHFMRYGYVENPNGRIESVNYDNYKTMEQDLQRAYQDYEDNRQINLVNKPRPLSEVFIDYLESK